MHANQHQRGPHMTSSAVRSFSDPDEYAEAIRQGKIEITITSRGPFTAELIRIDLHRLWMQRFSEGLSRIKHSDGRGGRGVIVFPTLSGPGQFWNTDEVQA